jgi:hypothetical protein
MQADERKPRQLVVECHFLAPIGFLVALPAVVSELTFVRIVLAVAGYASGRQLVPVDVARMTRFAFDTHVSTAQRKLGGRVVIEAHGLPFDDRVTSLAILSKPAAVFILFPVAGLARRRQILVALAGMAGGACRILVSADERKSCLCVVEGLYPAPGVFGVATFALLAKLSFMRIACLVALEASRRGIAIFYFLQMTPITCHLLVRACQHELRQRMIERLAVQLNDVELPPLVVGVAMPAIVPRCTRMAPMEPATGIAIGSHFLVAG